MSYISIVENVETNVGTVKAKTSSLIGTFDTKTNNVKYNTTDPRNQCKSIIEFMNKYPGVFSGSITGILSFTSELKDSTKMISFKAYHLRLLPKKEIEEKEEDFYDFNV